MILAQSLPVNSQQQVSFPQTLDVSGEIRLQCVLNRAIGGPIVLLRASPPDAAQDTKTVGLERQPGSHPAKKQNLLRARIADGRKLL